MSLSEPFCFALLRRFVPTWLRQARPTGPGAKITEAKLLGCLKVRSPAGHQSRLRSALASGIVEKARWNALEFSGPDMPESCESVALPVRPPSEGCLPIAKNVPWASRHDFTCLLPANPSYLIPI